MVDLRYRWHIVIALLAISTIAAKPSKAANIHKWAATDWNDPNSVPQVKHVQLFNAAANAYVRIINVTVDATTTNVSDPNIILKIDMYGPTLMAIRSYQTGKYICHNTKTGYVEIKVNRDPGCLFKSRTNGGYLTFTSQFNNVWHLAFQGKGKKTGQPRKGSRTSFGNKASKHLQIELYNLKKRKKG